MIESVREWLPIEVTARDAVRSRIGKAITDWSSLWIAERRVGVSDYVPTVGAARDAKGATGWRRHGRSLAITFAKKTRPLEWVLDVRLEQLELSDLDREILDAFERRLIEDLVRKIEAALDLRDGAAGGPEPIDEPLGRSGGVIVSVADDQGARLLSIAIPLAALLPLCKSLMAPTEGRPPQLASFASALGPETVTLEVTLGQADLSLPELRALAPGDVLVLDTPLEGSADLVVSGSDRIFARAKLTAIDGQMALTLQA